MLKHCIFFTFVLAVVCEENTENTGVEISGLDVEEGNRLIIYFRESGEDLPGLQYEIRLESSVLKYLECLLEDDEKKPYLTAEECRRKNFKDKALLLHGSWTGNATKKDEIVQAVKESWKEEEGDDLEDLKGILSEAKTRQATSVGCGYGYGKTSKKGKSVPEEDESEKDEEIDEKVVKEEESEKGDVKESGYGNLNQCIRLLKKEQHDNGEGKGRKDEINELFPFAILGQPSINMGPKLYTVGSGFLETHVTWKDIESALLNDMKVKAKCGPNKNVRQVGEGIGFMSRIAVIDADYEEEVELPQKFAVKIVTLLPSLGMAKSIKERHEKQLTDEEVLDDFATTSRNNHNREVDIYEVFSKFDNSLSKMPHVYFTQKFTKDNDLKGFIGMEFIENVVIHDISQNVGPDELFETIDALAYLEAKCLELNDEEKQIVAGNPIPVVYPPLIHPKAVSKMIEEMYATAPELEPAGKVLETMTADFVDLEVTSTLSEELGMQDVFVHGDLWSANLIWTDTARGLSLSAIVDYQLAHFGCAGEDLTRLFISTMSGKDRRENWERLLEKLHINLRKYCSGKPPFTLDQLKESYRRMFPIAGVLLLPTFGNVSEKDNTERKNLLSEKKLALFEDMLFFAKRNQNVPRSSN